MFNTASYIIILQQSKDGTSTYVVKVEIQSHNSPIRNDYIKKTVGRLTKHAYLTCSYMNNFHDGHVEVKYIPAHTNYTLGHCELKYLPLPMINKGEVAMKLSLGVTTSNMYDV